MDSRIGVFMDGCMYKLIYTFTDNFISVCVLMCLSVNAPMNMAENLREQKV